MVNRVFCYSKEVATQNGNKLPILSLVVILVLLIVGMPILIVLDYLSLEMMIALMVVGFTIFTFVVLIFNSRLRTKLTGWAMTSEGRIFHVKTLNNGEELGFVGYSAGSLLDELTGGNGSSGSTLGGALGLFANYSMMNRSAQYMQHPEIIARMVESAPNITGAEVFEVLKVYSITESKHAYNVVCDYKNIRKNKVNYQKKLKIEKSFNQLPDLINGLNAHK